MKSKKRPGISGILLIVLILVGMGNLYGIRPKRAE